MRIGHRASDTLLSDDDGTDVGGSGKFGEGRERVDEEVLYPLASHDFRDHVPYQHRHGRLLSRYRGAALATEQGSSEVELRSELDETSKLNRRRILPVRAVCVVVGRRRRRIEHVGDVDIAHDTRPAESKPLRESKVELALARTIQRAWLNQRHIDRRRRSGR